MGPNGRLYVICETRRINMRGVLGAKISRLLSPASLPDSGGLRGSHDALGKSLSQVWGIEVFAALLLIPPCMGTNSRRKTTSVKTIIGVPASADVRGKNTQHPAAKIGYFAQHHVDELHQYPALLSPS
ncbi:hypothetical protein BD309DRAFT_1013475 [Dichomitus squalens]|nr:hypothetical protein BD309DRAFT_1013475 [Dichomitus squalens]